MNEIERDLIDFINYQLEALPDLIKGQLYVTVEAQVQFCVIG